MCCFIVPLAEAIAVTAVRKSNSDRISSRSASPWLMNLSKLEAFLWGGTLMLIVDHILNGEVSWRYPFFTALGQEGGVSVMLKEMLTVGVPMAAVVTLAWFVLVLVSGKMVRVR